jgi:hypothetical protein
MPFLSPDGRYLSLYSFSGVGEQERLILVRRLADGQTTWLAGTEHAQPLAWSPDSRSLAVVAGDQIKSVDIETGGIRTLGRTPEGLSPFARGAWKGENILIGGPRLRRLSSVDGHVKDLYRADPDVSFQGFPSFLPDGHRFVYSQESNIPARRGVFLGSLDSPQVTRLLPESVLAMVSSRGYLLYPRQGTLFAHRFDLESNRLTGDPVRIESELLGIGLAVETEFAVNNDTLVWSNATPFFPPARLTWFDRNGRKLKEFEDRSAESGNPFP